MSDEDGTKASMEAIVRAKWEKGDAVSVVNATSGKVLGGCITAKEAGENVIFEGSVTGTIKEGDVLYYIYPRIAQNDNEIDFEGYSISLADQTYDANNSGKVCFHGYASDIASSSSDISKRIKFNLVTSYVHLNMANLPAKGFELSTIDISNINKGFKWNLSENTLTADAYGVNEGISLSCNNLNITQAGNAVVRFAIPASAKTDARVVTVNKAYKNEKYVTTELISSAYYNQLYTSWKNENVNVSPSGDKTEVTIDNLGSTEVAEGILPVNGQSSPAFTENKPTEISIGGIGTITFNDKASSSIKTNAGSSTNVLFKVEDVTKSQPVEAANLVYEITMKTVDENGTEVFSRTNAGENSEATVVIPLGQSVTNVTKVSLVDESGTLIEGGVIENSVKFENSILSFKVKHFSKYAIQYTEAESTSYVAQIGGRKYETLQSAIAAAQNGNTIQMIKDYVAPAKIEISPDKNIVIDLNGYTVSYSTQEFGAFITNKGCLKITDTSNGKNGKITAIHNKVDYSNGCYTIDNFGGDQSASKVSRLVIDAGTVENTSPGGGLSWPVNNGSWNSNAELIINGGTIHSVNYVPVREYLQYGGKKTVVINGGKFISDYSRAFAVQVCDPKIEDEGSSVTINGGEFECNGSGILYIDLHAENVNMNGFTMTVNGGKFKNANQEAPVLVYDNENKSQETAVLLSKILKGGTYSEKPADELLADGYVANQNSDGSWSVSIENFWPNFAASSFSSIDESSKTITISSPAELALLAKKLNGGTSYAGYTITINGSLDMGAHYWIPINAYNEGSLSGATIQGVNDAVISNLRIEKAVYTGNYNYYAGFIAQSVGYVTFKNLTFSGAVSVDNGSGVATVLGESYGNVLFDGVKIVNSTVSAETKAGALLGFTGGDGITVTVKDCSLDGVTVKAEYSYALMVGLVNTNDQVMFEGSNTVANSHAVLDENIAEQDMPVRKTIKGYTYGVDDNKLWIIGVMDAWAECRTNPTPKLKLDETEYSVMGDIFYHADGVVVDVCAPDPVAKIGDTKYNTLDDAFKAVTAGQTIEIIQAGTYTLPSPISNISVKGIDGVVFNAMKEYGQSVSQLNDVKFESVKFVFGNELYTGFQHSGSVTFTNCIFEGRFNSYGTMLFDQCTFNSPESDYSMWCYAGDVTYKNCTINCNGKFVNAYNEGNALEDGSGNIIPWKVVVDGCTFNSTKSNKAAINIKATCGNKPLYYDVQIINNCKVDGKWPEASTTETLVVGSALWQVDDINPSIKGNIKVTVDNEVVYPLN